jgi:hypothetical protein
MSLARTCGSCTLCCELPPIEPLEKPGNALCRHAAPGGGCTIYERRPGVCRAFNCFWRLLPHFSDEWKPDLCHFYVHQPNESTLVVMVDPAYPDAWRAQPFYDQIKQWSLAVIDERGDVYVSIGDRLVAIFPEEDLEAGPSEADDTVAMAYIRENGKRRPTVARRRPDGEVRIIARGRVYRDVAP